MCSGQAAVRPWWCRSVADYPARVPGMRFARSIFTGALACAALASPAPAEASETGVSLAPVVVTAQRRDTDLLHLPGNNSRIDAATISLVGHTHISEVMYRSPGVWISRGSGQESLTAIRSPVLTGPGSCGAFLFLENGLSIRPTGFCNVNELFEVNSEQADAIEVVRGPASNLYGSNALHGMINVIVAEPANARNVLVEGGPDGYLRGKLNIGRETADGGFRVLANAVHDGGWRDDSGYDQQKLNTTWQTGFGGGQALWHFAATNLNQETAGFIEGRDAYQDNDLRKSNPFPEAYRDAESQRLSARWTRALPDGKAVTLTPYARRSRMDFLQHFLPGQPVEKNGQESAGLEFEFVAGTDDTDLRWLAGLTTEYAHGFLKEFQASQITDGSDFLIETRPAGLHYDYDVDSVLLGSHVQLQWTLSPEWMLEAGARFEYLRYDYDNRMLDGNTDDRGNECGFGGCRFYRPTDRSDSFSKLAPRVALNWRFSDRQQLYAAATRGFRPPQATELYRLQTEQSTDEIDPEEIDSIEMGYRVLTDSVFAEVVGFYMKKRDFIFRDAEGFNSSSGRSLHRGVELDFRSRLATWLSFAASATYARHEYDFDRLAGGGEVIEDGNDVDTAPRLLGSARLTWQPARGSRAELEWVHVGDYYLDAANEHRYDGHDLFNLRWQQSLGPRWQVTFRLNNLNNTHYAERADFAFGNYRYFPGRDRTLFIEIGFYGS